MAYAIYAPRMARAGTWIVVVSLVTLAGCSPGAGVTVIDAAPDRDAAPDAVAIGDTGDVPGPDDLPLPGLLDPTDEPIPDDEVVRTGTLDNGLRYYIRHNRYPGGNAALRLAIDAGSVDEAGDATGVAHFVEHMLFNGTEQFPENELVDTLRSFGAAFGADVNASTGYDSTVYELSVPNDDSTVELGLTVLSEWLSAATIDQEQVVAERGVVLDEWRIRTQTTFGRRFVRSEQMFLGGTPYDGRSPIGESDSISSMDSTELRAYYDRWYRPDNAAIVVVGEIDVDEIEADIERLFGPATPRSDDPVDREPYRFPIDTEPDAFVHPDPDQQTVDVEVTFPLPATEGNGTAAIRATLLDVLAVDVLVRRLDRDVTAGTAPFDEISRGSNSFVDPLDAPGVYAFTDADHVDATLRSLLDEVERARRFGFTQEELDVSRDAIASFVQSRYDGRDSNQDVDYASTYVDDFLRDSGYPSLDTEYEVVTAVLDGITVDALDLRYRTRLANTAPHVIVSSPESMADRMPGVDEILAEVAATPDRELEPRSANRELPDELMAAPDPVDPVDETDLVDVPTPLFDPVRLDFGNGVTVILNANDIVDGQIEFEAASPGGLSLVADADVVDGLYGPEIVTSSGVGDLDASELDQFLAGVDVQLDAYLTTYAEHLTGTVASTDLEVLFQLVHLLMTEPRADASALRQSRSRYGPSIADPTTAPDLVGDDVLLELRYPDEPRYAVLPTPEEFETLDLDGVARVWDERFGNSDGWVFVLSGDLDVDRTAELAGAYLGTLPEGTPETPVDVEDPPPAGVVRRSVTAGSGDTGSVTMLFTTPVDDITADLRATADVATEVLAARLVDVVREELGDSYSPFVVSFVSVDPDPVVETYVYVSGAPDRVGSIGALVAAEFADLATGGLSDREFSNAYAQVEERYRFVDNWQFATELLDSETEPDRELADYLEQDLALVDVDAGVVESYLRRFVPADRYIEVTVTPR